MPIPDGKIDEVRAATDIVSLVSRYVPLVRSGSTYKAICPFHQEKTPSFHVWPETQTFKCFGCGKGGSVFNFVMERERLTFPEAVRVLARDASIDLGTDRSGPARSRREELREVLAWACRFFQSRLKAPVGEAAVEYCRRRGVEGETALRFRMGYAPGGFHALCGAAQKAGIAEDLLVSAGVAREGKQGVYDAFRDRLMFPISDAQGRVIAFGGRTLDGSEPKYLNSPDTPLFKKGEVLYGLDLAREEALHLRRLALVEGYTDVVMAHQHGVRFVVAALGTGLTREHAGLARRYADRVDLVYDGDTAGRKAAERALDVFLEHEADVRVTELPDGLDPCEFLLDRGGEAFLGALEGGLRVFEFLLERAEKRHDLASVSGKTSAVDDLLTSVAKAENVVHRDLLLRRMSERFGIPEGTLRRRLKIFDGSRSSVRTGPSVEPPSEEEPSALERPAERYAVEALVFEPRLGRTLKELWPPERFESPVLRAIAATVVEMAESMDRPEPASIAARISDPAAASRVADLLSRGRGKRDFERQLADCVRRLRTESRLVETREALARAREAGDGETRRRLERELFLLRSERA